MTMTMMMMNLKLVSAKRCRPSVAVISMSLILCLVKLASPERGMINRLIDCRLKRPLELYRTLRLRKSSGTL